MQIATEPTQLRRARIGAGLTQTELARRACLARETVNRAERYGSASRATEALIAQALGLPREAVFPDGTPRPREPEH